MNVDSANRTAFLEGVSPFYDTLRAYAARGISAAPLCSEIVGARPFRFLSKLAYTQCSFGEDEPSEWFFELIVHLELYFPAFEY
jgi:hypothetical protein